MVWPSRYLSRTGCQWGRMLPYGRASRMLNERLYHCVERTHHIIVLVEELRQEAYGSRTVIADRVDEINSGHGLWAARKQAHHVWAFLPSSSTIPTQWYHAKVKCALAGDARLGPSTFVCHPYHKPNVIVNEIVPGQTHRTSWTLEASAASSFRSLCI